MNRNLEIIKQRELGWNTFFSIQNEFESILKKSIEPNSVLIWHSRYLSHSKNLLGIFENLLDHDNQNIYLSDFFNQINSLESLLFFSQGQPLNEKCHEYLTNILYELPGFPIASIQQVIQKKPILPLKETSNYCKSFEVPPLSEEKFAYIHMYFNDVLKRHISISQLLLNDKHNNIHFIYEFISLSHKNLKSDNLEENFYNVFFDEKNKIIESILKSENEPLINIISKLKNDFFQNKLKDGEIKNKINKI